MPRATAGCHRPAPTCRCATASRCPLRPAGARWTRRRRTRPPRCPPTRQTPAKGADRPTAKKRLSSSANGITSSSASASPVDTGAHSESRSRRCGVAPCAATNAAATTAGKSAATAAAPSAIRNATAAPSVASTRCTYCGATRDEDRLEHRNDGPRNRVARSSIEHPERDQRLPGQARRDAELRREHAVAGEAQHRDRGGAQEHAEHEHRRRSAEQVGQRDARERQQEQRGEPRRHAEHRRDVPRTRIVRGGWRRPADDPGRDQAFPDTGGRDHGEPRVCAPT